MISDSTISDSSNSREKIIELLNSRGNPDDFARYIQSEFMINFSTYNGLYIFKDNAWHWHNDDKIFFQHVTDCMIAQLSRIIHSNTNRYIDILKSSRKLKDIASSIKNIFESLYAEKDRPYGVIHDFYVNNLDSNSQFIGFDNGIYDALNHKFLTNNLSQCMVSETVDYEYIDDFSDKKDNLMRLLKIILPDESVLIKLLKDTAQCIISSANKIMILCGDPCAIDVYIKLISCSLGKYYARISNDLIKTRGKSDEIELLSLIHKRIVSCESMDNNIDINKCANLTGRRYPLTDIRHQLIARKLHNQRVEFMPMYGLMIICDAIPQFDKKYKDMVHITNFPCCNEKEYLINYLNNCNQINGNDFMKLLEDTSIIKNYRI
jgi:hypothetical protein